MDPVRNNSQRELRTCNSTWNNQENSTLKLYHSCSLTSCPTLLQLPPPLSQFRKHVFPVDEDDRQSMTELMMEKKTRPKMTMKTTNGGETPRASTNKQAIYCTRNINDHNAAAHLLHLRMLIQHEMCMTSCLRKDILYSVISFSIASPLSLILAPPPSSQFLLSGLSPSLDNET